MTLGCYTAGTLLAARRAGLSEPDRLRLEAHLATCDACREDASRLAAWGDATLAVGASGAGARALSRALDGEPAVRGTTRARARAWPLAALAAAAAVTLAWVARPATWSGAPGPAHATAGAAHGHVLLTAPTRLVVGHGTLDAAAGAELSWEGTTVRLHRGEVTADVDPGAHLPFAVVTSRFVVRVTGTRFTVRERSVTVSRGSVRIESLRGDVLRARVGAGETWTFVEPAAATQPPATAVVATVVTPSVADARAVRPPERRADPRSDLGAAAPAPPPSPRARYEQAAALEARDADGALAVYSALAGENGPWAANATYAAARLESERGRRAEARALAEAYLRRWQDGPNAADARALLAEPTP